VKSDTDASGHDGRPTTAFQALCGGAPSATIRHRAIVPAA